MLEQLECTIQGTTPLLMHNVQLADPLNPIAQELSGLSSQRKKTQEVHEQIARIEWFGGLWVDAENRPVLPAVSLEACIRDGARTEKMGKLVEGSLMVNEDALLIYDGPAIAEDLWEDKRFVDRRSVVVQRNRVFRTRPIFRNWSAVVAIQFDNERLDAAPVLRFLRTAGSQKGIGDYRPHFGRFTVKA